MYAIRSYYVPAADAAEMARKLVELARRSRTVNDVLVSNAGPDAASGVTLALALPGSVAFTAATPQQGSYNFV